MYIGFICVLYLVFKGGHMDNSFVKSVTNRIKNKRDKKLIAAELESHILDKTDYYIELGYDKETAIQKANEDMGEPDDTALPLREMHKSTGNLILSLVLIFCGIACLIFTLVQFSDYSNPMETHSFKADIFSFGLLVLNSVFLIIGLKKKSKAITISAIVFSSSALLIGTLVVLFYAAYGMLNEPFPFAGGALFAPSLYAPIKTIISGFSGYSDSLLAESYITEQVSSAIVAVSNAVYFVFLTLGVFQLITIIRQEYLRKTRVSFKILKVAKNTLIFALALNILLMSVGTVIALINFPKQKELILTEKDALIELVIEQSPDKFDDTVLTENGFTVIEFDDIVDSAVTQTYANSGSNNSITYMEFNGVFGIVYNRTDAENKIDNISDYRLSFEEASKIEESGSSMTLQEFLDTGLYKKASAVEHTKSDFYDNPNRYIEQFTFQFSYDPSYSNSEYPLWNTLFGIGDLKVDERKSPLPVSIQFSTTYNKSERSPSYDKYWVIDNSNAFK